MNLPPDGVIRVTNRDRIAHRLMDRVALPGVPVDVPIGYFSMFSGDKSLEWDFSSLADYLRARTDDGRPYFDFWCPLSVVDGYGRHALDVWRGLRGLGAEAVLKASDYIHTNFLSPEILAERSTNAGRPPSRVSVAFTIPYDRMLQQLQSVTKIVITQFETDTVPTRHVEVVNRFRHLIVTSSFQPEVWKRSGCTIPISVMKAGIDTDFFAYRERPPHPTFNCLILGALSPRKNVPGAIRIFQEASQGNPDWRLTVKNRGAGAEIEKELRAVSAADPRIKHIYSDAAPQAVLQMYYDHDCLLWPTKGEGVGLPPLEAMATGMELVCSDNSGMKDYVDDSWCYPIKTEKVISADGPGEVFNEHYSPGYVGTFGSVGHYWQPDHGHAVKQLRRCFNAWLDGKGKGGRAAQYVRENHTLAHQARSVLRVVEEYL